MPKVWRRVGNLLKKNQINKLRDKLNASIARGDDYEVIYKLSTDLDKLIARYYAENLKTEENS